MNRLQVYSCHTAGNPADLLQHERQAIVQGDLPEDGRFWATWCLSCERELPDLQALWEEYQGRGAIVVGVAFQDEEAEVRETASCLGITYPLGLEPAGRISRAYGITAVPEAFVIDAQGQWPTCTSARRMRKSWQQSWIS
jgi:peroxiredoxin